MGLLRSSLASLRTDPRLLKVPPYLSLLCMLGGIIWMLLLPVDEYSRRTYISENALLPGQVHTYFHGTEQNIYRAYRHELATVLEPKVMQQDDGSWVELHAPASLKSSKIKEIFQNAGIKSATQTYSYTAAGTKHEGENVYGIVRAPRGDGTEAIVLVASMRNFEDQLNLSGVALLLTLGRYFSRWSLWSKDIILLVTPDTKTGPQAWIDAYLSQHDPATVGSLSLKSGAIQGVVCIDYPFQHPFHALHVSYDGINGQLPNLDLINTAISISSSQMGIPNLLQSQHQYAKHDEQHHYLSRLQVLFHGMRKQAMGQSTGAHSVFMPYHIDAITLTAVGDGWQDEMAFGRVVESVTRSLNNLLEKLHQSFFFYLLLQSHRFVSIGTYLPSAMAIGAGFTVMAIYLWVKSGYEEGEESSKEKTTSAGQQNDKNHSQNQAGADPTSRTGNGSDEPSRLTSRPTQSKTWKPVDRALTLPLITLTGLFLTSLVPATILVNGKQNTLVLSTLALAAAILIVPAGLTVVLSNLLQIEEPLQRTQPQVNGKPQVPTVRVVDSLPPSSTQSRVAQFYMVLKALSLLVLGLQLTVLATLNFSLSMFLGVFCSPLAFIGYTPRSPTRSILGVLGLIISCPAFILLSLLTYVKSAGFYAEASVPTILEKWLSSVSFGWNVCGAWGIIAGIFCVWLPAWVVGGIGVLSSFVLDAEGNPAPKVERLEQSTKENVAKLKKVVKEGAVKSKKR